MNALVVRYEQGTLNPHKQYSSAKRLIITKLSAELFETWKRMIELGTIDEVVLVGPAMCTGWRIRVDRSVRFFERPTIDERDAVAQEQAKYRILQRDHMVPESVSPYNLIQEWVKHDDVYYPWRVLVTCVLLNKTSGRQVRPIFGELFEKYQTPQSIIDANRDEIVAVLRPLGLQNVRATRLRNLSADFLQRIPMKEMSGVGQYAMDAFQIFCRAKIDIEPEDTWLKPYVEWRKEGGPPVEWPEQDFDVWWMDGAA